MFKLSIITIFCFLALVLITTNATTCSPHCVICSSNGICNQCSPNYFLFDSVCTLMCPVETYEMNGVCNNCSANCDICSSNTICTICSTDYSLVGTECYWLCPIGYYPKGAGCSSCSENCATCTSPNVCTACIAPYELFEGICIPRDEIVVSLLQRNSIGQNKNRKHLKSEQDTESKGLKNYKRNNLHHKYKIHNVLQK